MKVKKIKSIPFKYIIGDIGGTNSRIELCSIDSLTTDKKPKLIHRKDFLNKEEKGLEQIIKKFLKNIFDKNICLPTEVFIGVFCVAGPVENGKCLMTNLNWKISEEEIKKFCGLKYVHIQNDFKSIGYGVLHLEKTDFIVVSSYPEQEEKVVAVTGPGTGLGQCFVTYDSDGERYVHSSEGGHVNLPVTSQENFEIFNFTKKMLGLSIEEHLSAERIISGSGLEIIFNFYLKKLNIEAEEEEFEKLINQKKCIAPLITKYCFSKDKNIKKEIKEICVKTVEKFLELLAIYCGNVIVSYYPKGGFFVAGGIIAKIMKIANEKEKKKIISDFNINIRKKR